MNFTTNHTRSQTQNSSKHTKVSSFTNKCTQLIPKNKRKQKSEKGLLPNVFREAKFDEFFILIFIQTHKDGVVTSFRSSLEVEHHFSLLRLKKEKTSSLFQGFRSPNLLKQIRRVFPESDRQVDIAVACKLLKPHFSRTNKAKSSLQIWTLIRF